MLALQRRLRRRSGQAWPSSHRFATGRISRAAEDSRSTSPRRFRPFDPSTSPSMLSAARSQGAFDSLRPNGAAVEASGQACSGQALRQAQDRPFDKLRTGLALKAFRKPYLVTGQVTGSQSEPAQVTRSTHYSRTTQPASEGYRTVPRSTCSGLGVSLTGTFPALSNANALLPVLARFLITASPLTYIS